MPRIEKDFLGERSERGQSHFPFLASFSGRPQQLGFFFNQEEQEMSLTPFATGSVYPGVLSRFFHSTATSG